MKSQQAIGWEHIMKTEVGFRLAGGPQPLILLPVSVNGSQEREFILDTGAGTTLLTTELAALSGIRPTATKEGIGAGGKIVIQMGQADSVRVGQVTKRETAVAITDGVLKIGAVIGAQVHGTLGHSFFGDLRMTLDYHRCRLHLDGDPHLPDPGGIPFRLAHPEKPLVLVDTVVNGKGPYPFAVDTGASTSVIASDLARAAGILGRAAPAMTGGGGAVSASVGTIQSVAIGDATRENLPVLIAGFLTLISQATGARMDGIVGYNFLRKFQVVIDYPNSRLTFLPAAGSG
jgi:predicted aspartyl protease